MVPEADLVGRLEDKVSYKLNCFMLVKHKTEHIACHLNYKTNLLQKVHMLPRSMKQW